MDLLVNSGMNEHFCTLYECAHAHTRIHTQTQTHTCAYVGMHLLCVKMLRHVRVGTVTNAENHIVIYGKYNILNLKRVGAHPHPPCDQNIGV